MAALAVKTCAIFLLELVVLLHDEGNHLSSYVLAALFRFSP
jgi:hypothetical protein